MIANQIWQRFNGTGGIVYADARNTALRTLRAREGGATLTGNSAGHGNLLANDYANDPAINRSVGNYRYRTVVEGRGAWGRFDMIVDVYSRSRLEGDEIVRRASRAYELGAGAYNDYQTQVDSIRPLGPLNVTILFASRNLGNFQQP